MLVGGTVFARNRGAFVLYATAAFCLPALGWLAAARNGWVPWPSGTGTVGFTCGIIAALIIFFEMLLWVRKKLRRVRWLGSTRTWMALHIWLGLLSLPLAIGHSGFALGGSLSAAVMILFLLVIASGIWGLIMQQTIPRKLIDRIPGESIVTEMESLMRQYLAEGDALVARYRMREELEEEDMGATVMLKRIAASIDQLIFFFDQQIAPYLVAGRRGSRQLASPSRAAQLFSELRRGAAPDRVATVNRLEAICDTRRQLDSQARLYEWLHNWLCVHLPLSVALTVLLIAHILVALKYW